MLKHWRNLLQLAIVITLLYRISFFAFDHSIFKYAVQTTCFFTLILICLLPQKTLANWIKPPESESPQFFNKNWWLGGGVILVCTLAILEWQQSYYFTQEDAHSQFLPTIIQAARGLFSDGIFPTWNGYQLLGVPTATLGYHALTYPVTYFAYALARCMGNEFLTMEIFAWVHFIIGYSFGFLMFRCLHIRPSLAAAAALCFALLGFNLIAGRSWYYMTSTVAWLPALGYSLSYFMNRGASWRWVMGTALAIGLYFHAGNVQMWCYGTLFWGLGIVWIAVCKKEAFRTHIFSASLAALGGLAIAMPLLVVQAMETKDILRSPFDITITEGLKNVLLPWPLVTSVHVWGEAINNGTFYFSGGVFIWCFFVRCAFEAAYLGKGKLSRTHLVTLCFSLLGILALILAMGSQAMVWDWLAQYPPFSRFRIPLKVTPFFTFFMIAGGVLTAETGLRKLAHVRHLALFITILAGALSVHNAIHCIASFHTWADKPYPALLESQKIFQAEGFSTKGRLYPIAHWRSYAEGFTLMLTHNYPSIYNIPVITGYDTGNLEISLPENIHAGRLFNKNRTAFYHEFGVYWITVSKLPGESRPLNDADINQIRQASSQVLDLKLMDAFYIHDADTKPMAYAEPAPQIPLPYKLRTDGVDIDVQSLSSSNQTIIANFLYRHWFSAFTETGQPLSLHSDAMGRIAIELPLGAKILSVRYSPPWYYGLCAGLVMMVAVIALGWLYNLLLLKHFQHRSWPYYAL